MSIIDKIKFTVKCKDCNIVETKSIFDKGSRHGGSFWQSSVSFDYFATSWKSDKIYGPSLISATCKKCGKPSFIKENM